jgi:hypothetical protein
MNPTLSVSIHDENNLGDRVCNPCDYFDELKDVRRWNAWDTDWMYSPSSIIVGGGGLVHEMLERYLRALTRRPDRKLIAWGLGHNRHDPPTIDYRDTLNGFDLIGVRDYKSAQERGWDYVPCASCMSTGFDAYNPLNPDLETVVLYHHEHPMRLKRAWIMPWMANDFNNMGMVLAHICSARTVITNTYHGAYWAMLLGRKVLLYKPFSSRFTDFKYPLPICDENNWRDVEPFAAPAGYLEECRELNRKFYEKAKEVLGIPKHIAPKESYGTIEHVPES